MHVMQSPSFERKIWEREKNYTTRTKIERGARGTGGERPGATYVWEEGLLKEIKYKQQSGVEWRLRTVFKNKNCLFLGPKRLTLKFSLGALHVFTKQTVVNWKFDMIHLSLRRLIVLTSLTTSFFARRTYLQNQNVGKQIHETKAYNKARREKEL